MPEDCGIFDQINVNSSLPTGQFITWSMDRNFKATPPYNFYIDVAPVGSEDWTTLNKTPIVDDCAYLDLNKYNYGLSIDQTYRIRLIDGDDNVYYSNPYHPIGNWSKHDYLLAKEIMRKEYLNQIKNTGIKGMVLKRRQWGPKCPNCLDHDTDAILSTHCPICYSTGFIGGYFKPIEMWVTVTQLKRNKSITDLGVIDPFHRAGRSVAYPYIDTKDFWVNLSTNERWLLSNIEHTAEMRGVPLVYTAEYKKAPTSHIIYTVPLDSTADISDYYNELPVNSPVKLEGNDPLNPNNIPVPPEEPWDTGVYADPHSW